MKCPKCHGTGTVPQSEFGDRMFQRRRKLEMRQSDLAKQCGIKQAMISRYESGHSLPNIAMAKKIAEALGTTPRKLVYPDA